jgi:hypothetical protein
MEKHLTGFVNMFKHTFKEDLNFVLEKIRSKEPFAFARYADGELAVIENRHITGCDGWTITDQDSHFGQELLDSLKHTESNYFYGISCPCCDFPAYEHYKKLVQFPSSRVTFSNLFVNSNWKIAYDFFINYSDKIFICNENIKLNVPFYKVPADVLTAYRNDREGLKRQYESIAEKHQSTLFCISAGPLAELIIHWMYLKNPNNQYIDTGSCLDPYIHNTITRPYQIEKTNYNLKTCYM